MHTYPRCYPETNDDPAFLARVDRIVAGVVSRSCPEEVHVIRIDNWFDHKWLTFSGSSHIHFEKRGAFPPFSPGRVRSQVYFCRTTRGQYEEQKPAHLVHSAEREPTSRNQKRRIVDFATSAVFVWFSSESVKNGRGSVMVYSLQQGSVSAWFAAFRRDRGWTLLHVKGASRADVEELVESP